MERMDSETLPPLDPDTVRSVWSRTYNAEGKPDWSHIFPYYHPDIVFQDSIQRLQGIAEFKSLCERLTKRCKSLRMDIASVVQQDGTLFLEWKMTMTFRKFPNSPVFGCTRLRLHEDGRIIDQRDYYDLWGDIFDGIPWFRRPYRRFMHRYFG